MVLLWTGLLLPFRLTPQQPSGGLTSAITSQNASGTTSSTGIWGLWTTYRFGFGGGATGDSTTGGPVEKDESPRKLAGEIGDGGEGINNGGGTAQIAGEGKLKPADAETQETKVEEQTVQTQTRTTRTGQQYPLSTVVIVALIAFLIGSLLRSLLSPADFIYVVEADEAKKVSLAGGPGWREIKRLFEVKYVLGGWDFQVAAVRRHPL